MRFGFPVPSPYDAATYVVHDRYDISGQEPADWKMSIAFESADDIQMSAVCAGSLSAVPPWEIPPDRYRVLRDPAAAPASGTLYLTPTADTVAPSTLSTYSSLSAGGFGEQILCFAYLNVDPQRLAVPISNAIRDHRLLRTLQAGSRLNAFMAGEVAVNINAGDPIGLAQFRSGTSGNYRIRFGVITTIGWIDPIAFYTHIGDKLTTQATNNLASLTALIGTDWPFLGTGTTATPQAVNASAVTRLYPAPVLYFAKQCVAMTSADWRTVGNSQKTLYKTRLRNGALTPQGTPDFEFSTTEMFNPFQLEAVTEFFMGWPEPETAPSTPPAANAPNLPVVDLQAGDWNIVIIEPFSHPRLGSPSIPGPAFWLAQHHLSTTGKSETPNEFGPCNTDVNGNGDPVGPDYPADTYGGLLFLVYKGKVRNWYRWTTYSSHKWEDKAEGECMTCYTASVKGNVNHRFASHRAGSNFFANFGFRVWNDALPTNPERCGARHYFRAGTPVKPGIGKTDVMLHYGNTARTSERRVRYNASGGCLVSPSFVELRNRIVELYQFDYRTAHQQADPALLAVGNSSHDDYVALWYGGTRNGATLNAAQWNGKVSGKCWVIRPDEPTQK